MSTVPKLASLQAAPESSPSAQLSTAEASVFGAAQEISQVLAGELPNWVRLQLVDLHHQLEFCLYGLQSARHHLAFEVRR